MAGFRTHIGTSTALGIGYAVGAHYLFNVAPESCVLAGGLCSVSGMLPDLDSDSGVPLRESVAFAAAAVPVMMIRRFERLGMPLETMIMCGMVIYLVIRFGLAKLLKKYTVHRGMFHSLPAALIAAEIAFLLFDRENLWLRYYTAGGVLLGFLSHLVLDEIWSIDFRRGVPRLKKSFGTALKFWGDSLWANISTYAKVILLTYLVARDPQWMAQFETLVNNPSQVANQASADLQNARNFSTSASASTEVSATPPVYYEPARLGSREQTHAWK
jgi:membrane-bound metal-dependent hydrolase YbcI (DUF457 family)